MIILIGMPGVGKSTVARQLARRLELRAVDSDKVIEQRLGTSIRSYFAQAGEAAFRDLEEEVIRDLTAAGPSVLATGGGVVLRAANRERLRASGTVVYLHAGADFLYRRLRHDTKRPLLQVGDPLARLKSMYAERDPLYRACAHFTIEVQHGARAMLVSRVLMQLDLMPQEPRAPQVAAARNDGAK